jgi:DNA invertase Pin-like site-specific DNA recombinase
MAKTAYYLRVSSKSQDTKSQHADIEAHRANNPDSLEPFRDKFTGRTMSRPGWDALWKEVEAGKVTRIVVWRLDRLGRTVSGLSALFEECLRRKVALVSIRDGLDLSTPAGRLMSHVLASVAMFETEVRSERQLAGIAAAREANGGRCPWGGGVKGRRVKVSKEVERAMRRMRAEGSSIAEIARVLGLTRPVVYKWLKMGKYAIESLGQGRA